MKTLFAGRGSSPTHCPSVGRKARPTAASLRRLPTSGFRPLILSCWLLASGLLSSVSGFAASAAPVDLGQHLTYVRIRHLPDDGAGLAAVWNSPALVVDLRYPAGGPARALPADLPVRARTAPLFLLVGPLTPADVVTDLRARAPALVTLGLSAPSLAPDIVLSVNPEADRRAYDAFESGTPAEALISEKLAKPRFDEAALAREHTSDTTEAGNPDANAGSETNPQPSAGPPPAATANRALPPAAAAPPKDAVLQRAVQLHRALLALGRLPRD
jgi:hypothetical protein